MDSKHSSEAWPIPGFDVLEKIGEGGMGMVYRANQHQPPRTVAIKFLAAFPSPKLSIEAFQRESRLMASLNHPNVVTIHDCGQVEGRHYMVMEYVSGPPLRTLLKPGVPWEITSAAEILDGIGQALCFIHDQGILHLDLKPENVLCPHGGGIKITDFGLAIPRLDARTLSELGLTQGTIDYCAPEQRHGLPIDQRSDLFSLAVIAYELLTGYLPGRVYRPASKRNPLLPAGIDDVLRRALARDREDRYESLTDFRKDLARVLGR